MRLPKQIIISFKEDNQHSNKTLAEYINCKTRNGTYARNLIWYYLHDDAKVSIKILECCLGKIPGITEDMVRTERELMKLCKRPGRVRREDTDGYDPTPAASRFKINPATFKWGHPGPYCGYQLGEL